MDFDFVNQIVNLTPHDETRASTRVVTQDFSPLRSTLVYRDFRSGFQVVNYHKIEAGLGARIAFWFDNANGLAKAFWSQVGIIPMKGKEMMTVRYAADRNAVQRLPSLHSAPTDARDLNSWTSGDAATYVSKGGVFFFTGAGLGAVGANATALAQGQFQTYVEKVDSAHVFVKTTEVNLNSLSLQSGAALVSVGTSKFDQIATSMSFMININEELGRKAYEDFVRGNVAAAQKLAATPNAKIVRRWDKVTATQSGKFKNLFFGLPIVLNTVWSQGKVHEFSRSQFFFDDTRASSHYGIYMKERKTRVFEDHEQLSEAFYGSAYSLMDSAGRTTSKGIFGQFVWNYNNDDSGHRNVKSAITNLVRKTGLRKHLYLNIPTVDTLKFTTITMRVNFNEEQTKRMISNAATGKSAKMTNFALNSLAQYKALGADIDGLCNRHLQINKDNPAKAMEQCERSLESRTKAATAAMYTALSKMSSHLAKGEDKKFADAYARFGEAMLENQFTFKTALALAGSDVAIDYVVEGTDISSYLLTLNTSTNGEVVKTKRDAQMTQHVGRGRSSLNQGVILVPGQPGGWSPGQK